MLATGKPTSSSPYWTSFSWATFCTTEGRLGFVSALECLPDFEIEALVEDRVKLARQNSWEARFAGIKETVWGKS